MMAPLYVSFIRNGNNEESYILDSINMKPKQVQHEQLRKKELKQDFGLLFNPIF